ncbi:MAG: MBOAT family O-acyltransferase [Planctomycetota bacterium]
MLFNTYKFLAFFVFVYAIYRVLDGKVRTQNLLLLTASYLFYAAWDWRFLALIWASTAIDYTVAHRVDRETSSKRRRGWLCCSIAFNLGCLGFFKYADFGIQSFASMMQMLGLEPHFSTLGIILPVGISFYTFQTLGYSIDVYRRRTDPSNDLIAFALFVAYFPQLVAGPIESANRLLPQLNRKRSIRRLNILLGLHWIALGYFKKVVLADCIAPLVNQVFESPDQFNAAALWTGAIAFALQIYGDFAGYSLIALGISELMGIRLRRNFAMPYLSRSPSEFWHRWHISLSRWLRDYLYIPLGGNRAGAKRTKLNLLTTMTIGGLWHGAAWNFVLWGVYHGLLLMFPQRTKTLRKRGDLALRIGEGSIPGMLSRLLQTVGTFLLITIGWVLFRCPMSKLGDYLSGMFFRFDHDPQILALVLPTVAGFGLLMAYHFWQFRSGSRLVLMRMPLFPRVFVYTFLVASPITIGFQPTSFIYFQF